MRDIFRYAFALEQQGRTDSALNEYRDLADARLGGPEPLVRRARLLMRLGRSSDAEADLLEVDLWQASELEEAGQGDRAIGAYTDLIDAGVGGVEPLFRRADLLRRLGRFAEAETDFRDVARQATHDGLPLRRLAQLAWDSDRPWLAASRIQAAIDHAPGVAEFRVSAMPIFISLGWFDRAFAAVAHLPSADGKWDHTRDFARREYLTRRGDAAARLQAYRRNPDDILATFELSLALFYIGRVRMAAKLCEAVMRDRPHSFAAFEFHAKILARWRGASEALDFLLAVASLHANDPDYIRMTDMMGRQVEQL